MKNLQLRIITGFRETQSYTISSEEAHKAYYLFLHPEERAVFENGVALVGKNIQSIEPDYQATMGWNATYELQGEDWNEIRKYKVDIAMNQLLAEAKQIAKLAEEKPKLLDLPFSQIEKPHIVSLPNSDVLKRIG